MPEILIKLLIETHFKPARNAHCRIGVELGIFEHLKESGVEGASVKAVAEKAKAEEPLIGKKSPNTFKERS